jgi:hypothetical protein
MSSKRKEKKVDDRVEKAARFFHPGVHGKSCQEASQHGQLGISLVFPPFDVRGGILVSAEAVHVGSTDRNRY